jgi:hypothetical protein
LDDGALSRRQTQGALQRRCDRLERHADEPARYAPTAFELRQHRADLINGNGEANVVGLRADRRVDADDFSARVDQRTATIAEVNRRISLNVIVKAVVEQLAAHEGHDANGNGVDIAKWIADGADPFANPQGCRVTKSCHGHARRGPGVNGEECNVDRRIGANDARAEAAAVRQRDRDPVGTVNHVKVREDVTFGVDDEPAAGALARSLALRLVQIAAAAARATARARVDVHDGGIHA